MTTTRNSDFLKVVAFMVYDLAISCRHDFKTSTNFKHAVILQW